MYVLKKLSVKGHSPWIHPKERKKNIKKLKKLQKFIKKMLIYWRFKRWINSKEGIEWIYDPQNIGGIYAKRDLERIF